MFVLFYNHVQCSLGWSLFSNIKYILHIFHFEDLILLELVRRLAKVYSLNEKNVCCLFICLCMLQLLQFALNSHYVCRISFLEDVFATTILLTRTTAVKNEVMLGHVLSYQVVCSAGQMRRPKIPHSTIVYIIKVLKKVLGYLLTFSICTSEC